MFLWKFEGKWNWMKIKRKNKRKDKVKIKNKFKVHKLFLRAFSNLFHFFFSIWILNNLKMYKFLANFNFFFLIFMTSQIWGNYFLVFFFSSMIFLNNQTKYVGIGKFEIVSLKKLVWCSTKEDNLINYSFKGDKNIYYTNYNCKL